MAAARITSLRGHMLGICLKLFQPLFESGREFDFPVCALRTNPYSTVHIGERNQHWPTCVYKLCLLPWLWEGGGSCPRSHEVITYLPIWGSGCSSVDRAVASDVRCPWFKSSHWQTFLSDIYLLTVNCIEKTNIRRMTTFLTEACLESLPRSGLA